jgi:hypothetical protein
MPRKRSRRAGVMGAKRLLPRSAKGVSQTPWRLPALHLPWETEERDRANPAAHPIRREAERWLKENAPPGGGARQVRS